MENPHKPELTPTALPTGTRLNHWCVVGRQSRGTYGTVYRVVNLAEPQAEAVALKLAVHPEDPRFEREVGLLSRIHSPHVPRLRAQGFWRQGSLLYPYIVMDWVEGELLYKWAVMSDASSRQAMKVLAQVARALQVTHAIPGVHRDVKGDNIRVGAEGRAFLLDFGAGTYTGVSRLTWEPQPPGTLTYRSPEAWGFALQFIQERSAHYPSQPTDDLFSLGVTAYRLVTGEHPPSTDPGEKGSRVWYEASAGPRAPHALNPRVDPQLGALILRMLSVRPEARGTAQELAKLLEQEALEAGPKADQPLFERASAMRAYEVRSEPQAPAPPPTPSERAPRPAPARKARAWQALASASLLACLIFWAALRKPRQEREEPILAQDQSQSGGAQDGGTSELAQEVLTAPMKHEGPIRAWSSITLDLPPKPLPGQRRPDSSGKCLRGSEQVVAINGGCWIRVTDAKPPCDEDGYEWAGGCYYPMYKKTGEPTSNPPESRPGDH